MGFVPEPSTAAHCQSPTSKELYRSLFRNISSAYSSGVGNLLLQQSCMPKPSVVGKRKMNMEMESVDESGGPRICLQFVESRLIPFGLSSIGDHAWDFLSGSNGHADFQMPSEDDPNNSTVFRACARMTPSISDGKSFTDSAKAVGQTTEIVIENYEKTVVYIFDAVLDSLASEANKISNTATIMEQAPALSEMLEFFNDFLEQEHSGIVASSTATVKAEAAGPSSAPSRSNQQELLDGDGHDSDDDGWDEGYAVGDVGDAAEKESLDDGQTSCGSFDMASGTEKPPREERPSSARGSNRYQRRQKEELKYLKSKVRELEDELRRVDEESHAKLGNSMWQRVAQQQSVARQQSISENVRLREELSEQIKFSKSLEKIIRKRAIFQVGADEKPCYFEGLSQFNPTVSSSAEDDTFSDQSCSPLTDPELPDDAATSEEIGILSELILGAYAKTTGRVYTEVQNVLMEKMVTST
ncbi:unnamed protein product [Phytophthora lilii]|uniref:Unnamed protein product n=1 Tax=Phytophthora lilii TaxID=2077276 RepID=A0A9W6U0B7_9STRA|nr:unnamed protein product [Phytophthora lilii]